MKNGRVCAAEAVAGLLCCSSLGRREKPSQTAACLHLHSTPATQQMLMDPKSPEHLHIHESKQVYEKYSMAGQQLVGGSVVLIGGSLSWKRSAICSQYGPCLCEADCEGEQAEDLC